MGLNIDIGDDLVESICAVSKPSPQSMTGSIPVHHDGSALVARRSELDAWLLHGGGRRS